MINKIYYLEAPSQNPVGCQKERSLKKTYVADIICYDCIIVELKALDKLSGREEAQILNYLKATGLPVVLLINFGSHGKLQWKRFARSRAL